MKNLLLATLLIFFIGCGSGSDCGDDIETTETNTTNKVENNNSSQYKYENIEINTTVKNNNTPPIIKKEEQKSFKEKYKDILLPPQIELN